MSEDVWERYRDGCGEEIAVSRLGDSLVNFLVSIRKFISQQMALAVDYRALQAQAWRHPWMPWSGVPRNALLFGEGTLLASVHLGDQLRGCKRCVQAWREANGIDTILQQRQPAFRAMKELFEHGALGMSKTGHVVFIERLGQIRKNWHAFLVSTLFLVLTPNLSRPATW